jgi:hypothetical protein
MSNAAASRLRPAQKTPNVRSSATPGTAPNTYSGECTRPTIESFSRLPLSSAVTVSPGRSELRVAKASLTSTSLLSGASTQRPATSVNRLIGGSPRSGKAIIRPTIGSITPGRSSRVSRVIVACISATPGMSSRRAATLSGARFSRTNTCAKRALS